MKKRQALRVGIDEAGYGPNLGPLCMSALSAVGPANRPPDLWQDRATSISRAGDRSDRLWVDDSKAILKGRKGFDRLLSATIASLESTTNERPADLASLLSALGAGSYDDVELTRWLEGQQTIPLALEKATKHRPLDGPGWSLSKVQSVVVGPEAFERGIQTSRSKAVVHFEAFGRLLRQSWEMTEEGRVTFVRSDKHGGRHFYLDLLSNLFPGIWIDRGDEGPARSHYTLREGARILHLELVPKADSSDGLVALASIVSKTLRELWMDVFNAYWRRRLPELKPTAGYPYDARRFRQEIEPIAELENLPPSLWWRSK
jgi:hypothetical protein